MHSDAYLKGGTDRWFWRSGDPGPEGNSLDKGLRMVFGDSDF